MSSRESSPSITGGAGAPTPPITEVPKHTSSADHLHNVIDVLLAGRDDLGEKTHATAHEIVHMAMRHIAAEAWFAGFEEGIKRSLWDAAYDWAGVAAMDYADGVGRAPRPPMNADAVPGNSNEGPTP